MWLFPTPASPLKSIHCWSSWNRRFCLNSSKSLNSPALRKREQTARTSALGGVVGLRVFRLTYTWLKKALSREILEELDVKLLDCKFFLSVDHHYPDFRIKMHSFICEMPSVSLNLRDHLDSRWLDRNELSLLEWAAADLPIVAKLQTWPRKDYHGRLKEFAVHRFHR